MRAASSCPHPIAVWVLRQADLGLKLRVVSSMDPPIGVELDSNLVELAVGLGRQQTHAAARPAGELAWVEAMSRNEVCGSAGPWLARCHGEVLSLGLLADASVRVRRSLPDAGSRGHTASYDGKRRLSAARPQARPVDANVRREQAAAASKGPPSLKARASSPAATMWRLPKPSYRALGLPPVPAGLAEVAVRNFSSAGLRRAMPLAKLLPTPLL